MIFFSTSVVFAQEEMMIEVVDISLIDTVSEDKVEMTQNQLSYVAIGITVDGVVIEPVFP